MDSESQLTFEIVGPVIIKMCDDVPQLQSLLQARNRLVTHLEKRLIRERRIKNQWKQRAIDLGYGEFK